VLIEVTLSLNLTHGCVCMAQQPPSKSRQHAKMAPPPPAICEEAPVI